jgi:hypothetical protein
VFEAYYRSTEGNGLSQLHSDLEELIALSVDDVHLADYVWTELGCAYVPDGDAGAVRRWLREISTAVSRRRGVG